MKTLVWRLEDRPTAMEIVELVKTEIIDQTEAKHILFNETETSEK